MGLHEMCSSYFTKKAGKLMKNTSLKTFKSSNLECKRKHPWSIADSRLCPVGIFLPCRHNQALWNFVEVKANERI